MVSIKKVVYLYQQNNQSIILIYKKMYQNTKIQEVSKNTLISINKKLYRSTGLKNGNKYQVIEIGGEHNIYPENIKYFAENTKVFIFAPCLQSK